MFLSEASALSASRPRARSPRVDLDAVERAVAAMFGVPVGELRATTRKTAAVAFARQSAMYLAHVALGLSYTAAGRAFGRDRTTAAYACRLVEALRDDPDIDAAFGALEQTLTSRLQGGVAP